MRHYFIRVQGERVSAFAQATSYSEANKYLLKKDLSMVSAIAMLREALEKGQSKAQNTKNKTVELTVSADM